MVRITSKTSRSISMHERTKKEQKLLLFIPVNDFQYQENVIKIK